MKSLSNVGAERLGDALGESIDDGAKLSIISSYFTVFAYGELKEELSKVDEVRFLFSEPTFIKRMADSKEPREFEVARRAREVGVGGSGLELTLRNNLNQRALARECAEWIREKGVFKSAKTSGAIQPGGTYVVENPSGDDHAFMGAAANFTQEGLGYERRPGTVTCVSHFENATEAVGLKMMFESVWDNPAMVEEVTAQVAALPREPARVHLFPDPVPPVPRLHGGRRGQRHPPRPQVRGVRGLEQALRLPEGRRRGRHPQAGEVQGLHHRRLGGPGQDLRGARRQNVIRRIRR